MTTMDRLLAEAMELSDAERAELADSLYETLSSDELRYEAEWIEEFDRRMAKHRADPSSSIPVEQARRILLGPFDS